MSCGKYLVVCIVLCYVNIKRTETRKLIVSFVIPVGKFSVAKKKKEEISRPIK